MPAVLAGNAWLICALSSAVLWGLSYALSEKILKEFISPYFYMAFTGFIYFFISLCLCLFMGNMKAGLQTLAGNKEMLLLTLFTSVCYAAGALLIYMAISLKNATLANIIEISYPLFTLLFAWIIFKDVQLTSWTAFGSLLVLSGVSVIALKG